jgi:hypothetical protein
MNEPGRRPPQTLAGWRFPFDTLFTQTGHDPAIASPRPHSLRTLLPFLAAVPGFFAGLAIGALAEILIVPIALLATGHPHPLRMLDDSFNSRPFGALAFLMVAGYFTTAFFGAFAAFKTARNLSRRRIVSIRRAATAFVRAARNFRFRDLVSQGFAARSRNDRDRREPAKPKQP